MEGMTITKLDMNKHVLIRRMYSDVILGVTNPFANVYYENKLLRESSDYYLNVTALVDSFFETYGRRYFNRRII